jgi:hypothetical protein
VTTVTSASVIANPPRKRKRETDEIRDSEDEDDLEGSDDEDYGWAEDDEVELPEPPPQWQGSEDILVPAIEGEEEEDYLRGINDSVEEKEEEGQEE